MKITSIITASMLSALGTAHAATLITSTVSDITGASDVSTLGDTVFAYNFTPDITALKTTTVNTVVFDNVDKNTLGARLKTSAGDLSFDEGRPNGLDRSNATAYLVGGMTGTYGALLEGGLYRSSATAGNFSIGFSGLDAGTYQLQVWLNDSRANSIERALTLTAGTGLQADGISFASGTSALGSLGTVDYNTTNLLNGNGQYITAEFTLTGAENGFYIQGNGTSGQYNALQLRAIPEPSSAALIGLAGLGLLIRRRR